MTTDPREMQAGAELDAALAHEIFGWHWLQGYDAPYSAPHRFLAPPDREGTSASGNEPIRSQACPAFSSDPAASAELKAKLWEMGFYIEIRIGCEFVVALVRKRDEAYGFNEKIAITGPDPRPAEFLAVARCALIAVRARKGAK